MSYDVTLSISGKVSNAEAVFDLASSAAAEGMVDWNEGFATGDFVPMLEKAAAEGQAVTLTRKDTTSFFEGVTGDCRVAGLSYVVNYGVSGEEGFTNGFTWRPGMAEDYGFLLDGENPALPLADVRRAAAKGLDAVNALVDRVATLSSVGKVEIEPGLLDAYRAFAGDEDAPSDPWGFRGHWQRIGAGEGI